MSEADMSEAMTDLDKLARGLRGWRELGDKLSNGEVMCAGCWDRSEHDTNADHDIPRGQPVWYSMEHPEYGDCDAYCTACVAEDAEAYEMADIAEAIKAHIERTERHG